ncbi:MAG TPA: hypothetical protein PK360_09740 [bacterium]|nr:hypothetical protein [bacterium]
MGWQELIALLIAAACGYYVFRSFQASWKGQGGCAKCPASKPKPIGIGGIGVPGKKVDPARYKDKINLSSLTPTLSQREREQKRDPVSFSEK